MSITKTYTLDWTSLVTDMTADVFMPATDFMNAGGFNGARGWMELRGRFGGALVSPAFQTANDPRSPDMATQIDIAGGDVNGYANANGVFDPDTNSTSIASNGKTYIRLGWIIKLSGAGTGGARVRGTIQLFQ